MSMLDISKTLMYEFWYDYGKPKNQEKTKLCHIGTDSFIIHIKILDFYKVIANVVGKWFDTSNCDENNRGPLPIGKNKKVIGVFKDALGRKTLKDGPRAMDLELKRMHT